MLQNLTINRQNHTKLVFNKWWLFLLFLLGLVVCFSVFYNPNDDNRQQKTENEKTAGNGSSKNTKPDIKVQNDQKMYQLGKHFNTHGRSMGFASKDEYNRAAVEFAKTNRNNPNAKIFEGLWRTRGDETRDITQIIISNENKTVIKDKMTGQVIDFYLGTEFRGFIQIISL